MRRILASYLTAETFDSAALSGTAVVSHPLPKSGEWHALLTLGRSPLPVQNVLVLPDGGAAMVAIEPGAEAGQRLRAGGHVRLRAPDQSAGFAAQLRHASRETAAWNSKRLEEGDYFACLPLRPGRYRLVNRLSDSLAAVVVHYPDPRKQRKPEQLSAPVEVRAGATFDPARLELFPGQPLIVAIAAPAHLVLTLESADDGPEDLAAWRQRSDADALNALGRKKHR